MSKQQTKKRNTKTKPKPEPIEDEYEEEYEEEEEEEEEDEEDDRQARNNESKKKESTHQSNDIIDDLEGKPEDEEEERLVEAAHRVSHASTNRKASKNNITTMSDMIVKGRRKLNKKEKIIRGFQSKWFSVFMILVTGWTMISEDLRLLAPKAIDPLFFVIIIICIIIFVTDIAMSFKFKKDYYPSTYFIVDIVVTLTVVILDIGWIWYGMLGVNELAYDDATGAYETAMKDEGIGEGTRVARIARIIRLFRLIRIFKMYRHSHAYITFVKDQKYETAEERLKRKVKGEQEESKVGKKLSDLTTRRVLILVILMLLFVPIFTITTYKEENTYFSYGLDIVERYSDDANSPIFMRLYQSYINEHNEGIPMPVTNVYVSGVNQVTFNDPDVKLGDMRPYEVELVKSEDNKIVGVFNFKYIVNLTAALAIVRTFYTCGVLALAAVFFSRDATFLVIRPIEGMISKVNRIAKNPLEAAQEEENAALALERVLFKQNKKGKGKGKKQKQKQKSKDTDFETAKIEQTIIKIGALLALGFGEAGAKIIADNMGRGGDVNPMVPGNKVVAIFGFCDIRNFTDATEVLQEDVMLFVNEVADIVHGVVDRYSGAANKNIGDAFLLVWKFNSEDVEEDENGDLQTKKNSRNAQLADMSVISFLKIIADIRKSHKLERYSQNKQILEKLPNFQVKLGYGLHVGWAIEGAIGSDFKIDASYLSPNVNTASRLEAATKQFGVPLLISGELKMICTPRTQSNMRTIDIVTVKGSNEPIHMVTCDVNEHLIKVEYPKRQRSRRQDKKMKKVRGRIERNRYKQAAMSNQIQVSEKFELDEDIKLMRTPFTKEFFDTFKAGFSEYIAGKWDKAKKHLEKIEGNLIDKDAPTRLILETMKESNFQAPPSWNGYRILTEK